ncbi:RNA 2'-phosphotransferase [Saccharibacillus sp. CPCC 101409]|uniref:RNA 2'-phosphotransferase n=1 Tax=Saccharibacillus sp. CPCC 101409 TaxID=3058041 RepID=UPI002671DF9F|nr:RNA 2'-phosphotransferase [Saccharibacillus sp. CPCC 101409]MDO3408342.1 RNA 2'-phosphotransferase [Saccharibacillus sp. CPCC 101409]
MNKSKKKHNGIEEEGRLSASSKAEGTGNPHRGQGARPKLSAAERDKKLSKLMSMMLRHKPEESGLRLDPEDGSCGLDELLAAIRQRTGFEAVTEEDVRGVVRRSDKQRFEIVEPGEARIRARYGHSFGRVNYPQGTPPAVLYHGTGRHALPSIEEHGLLPMGREYVHLSADTHFAALAGRRKGKLIMLRLDTAAAAEAGVAFYDAGSGVWLAERVPSAVLAVDGQYEDEAERKPRS